MNISSVFISTFSFTFLWIRTYPEQGNSLLTFLYNLIVSGTSYLSTQYDPEGMENVESIVIIPTTIYFGYQQVILLLSIFGNILNKLRD